MKIETSFWNRHQLANWLGILGLILLFIALRWNSCGAPLIRDEGEYAYAAQLLIHGVMPYEHAFIQKPPMVVYSYALANLIWPKNFWAPRLLAYVFVALATILLGYIAKLEFGKGFALPTMWLVTPMILLPGIEQFPANTEMFLLLPLLATVAIYVHSRHHGQKLKYWLGAGFFGATTLCYKYTALPVLAFIFVVWSVESWRQRKEWKPLARCWLAAFTGAVVAAVLELGIFLLRDGGRHLWECTVQFNRHYAASSNFGLTALWLRLETFWSAWWILFLVPFAAILKPHPRRWFWIGIFICSVLATSASFYGHYYILIMPFWALLSAVGVRSFAARFAEWSPQSGRWLGSSLTIIVLILLLRPDASWLTCSRERFVDMKMAGFPFVESQAIARRVAQLSAPDEFVFVAGSEPEILFYAQRFSPTRFITAYAMMIPTAVAQKYQRAAIADLLAHPPKLVVFTTAANSWLLQADTPPDFQIFLRQFLQQNYVLIGGCLPGKKNGGWSEPLAADEVADANLLLFQRKTTP